MNRSDCEILKTLEIDAFDRPVIRRVLVTGAAGLFGSRLVASLSEAGFRVTAFELPGRIGRKAARRLPDTVRWVWGDIRDRTAVDDSLINCDAIVHLAFLIPPDSEKTPEQAYEVNVEGSRNLIRAALSKPHPPAFLFASSYTVYGDLKTGPLVKTIDPPSPFNHYTEHKKMVEDMVQASDLNWTVMRFGVIFDTDGLLKRARGAPVFDIPANGRQEVIDVNDAALAVVRLMQDDSAWCDTYNIGGGKACRLRYADMINGLFNALGLPSLPDEAFSTVALQGGCWMDTTVSRERFGYQRAGFEDIRRRIIARMGFKRRLIRIAGPLIRYAMLRMSPYHTL